MSNDKPRYIIVPPGAELDILMAAQNDLGTPRAIGPPRYGGAAFDADELRAWRAAQHTSGVTNGDR